MEDSGYQLDKKFDYNYIFIKKNKHVNFLEHLVNVRNDSYGLTENLQEMWVKQVEKNIEGFNFDYGIKFSFLIPTYKRHELLQRAINSVFQQKYKNIEILVCSDGDDIDVKNIVESYQDNRIKYYFTERTNNSGASQRNLLSKIATGDFIIFLDDDNYIYENYLDTILKHIEKDDDMIVYKIDIEGHIYPIIPLENKIEHGKIDTLNFIINRRFLSIEWVSLYMHDFIHFKTIEYLLINENKKIKYINAILAKHGANI
jgi:glycosyltransferase involved in cell wall biosynthesis